MTNLKFNDILSYRLKGETNLLQQNINGSNKPYINYLKSIFPNVRIKGSTQNGLDAHVPWICFFNNESDTARKGLFTALLFNYKRKDSVSLVLMEGSKHYQGKKLTKQDYRLKRKKWFNQLQNKYNFIENDNLNFLDDGARPIGFAKNTITYKEYQYPVDEAVLFKDIRIFINNAILLHNKFDNEIAIAHGGVVENVKKLNKITQPETKIVQATLFKRSVEVKKYVLEREKGICALCKQAGPFKNNIANNQYSFLEVAHIKALKDNGYDNPKNTVGLCPNCHRKLDHWDNPNEIEKIKKQLLLYAN